MEPVTRITPVAYAQQRLAPKTVVLNGMEIALEYASAEIEDKRKRTLGICDVSCLPRFGVKGLKAVQWLQEHKIAIPAQGNRWTRQTPDALVLRLGLNEFLIEDQLEGKVCEALRLASQPKAHGLYPVARNDTALILSGSGVQALFSEVCALDLRDQALAPDAVVMAQMAGISVTLLRQTMNNETVYRLWCDGTYGPYLWDTLLEIAEELGGGAVGVSCHFKEML
jgi:sarcosine oxidase subunit gamma